MSDLLDLAQKCAEWDPNPLTSAEAKKWIAAAQNGDAAALKDLELAFGSRLEFGTAGLRGEMGTGLARMNDLTVIQAAQGLAAYIVEHLGDEGKTRGVVLGYDHRARAEYGLSSVRFALLTAAALMTKGIKVELFRGLVCTPMVPFGIVTTGAAAGVMVTASHNPKRDNGYKVYGGNGAQIIAPVDKHIADAIAANQAPWPEAQALYVALLAAGTAEALDQAEETVIRGHASGLCVSGRTLAAAAERTEALVAQYMQQVHVKVADAPVPANSGLVVTYTAMHGVGAPFARRVFSTCGLPALAETAEQVVPDPEFPTVAFPNPEEGKGALALAMQAAAAAGSPLILANDPDADRLAVAELQSSSNEWRVFTGNEIGILLAHWLWTRRLAAAEAGGAPLDRSKVWLLASTVSSKMLGAMAAVEGIHFEETLTGFKWMGNVMQSRKAQGEEVLFSFEEAIGFCCGDIVPDKDGVSAAAVFAQMAHTKYAAGGTVAGYLDDLYKAYGYFVSDNGYVFVDDPKKTLAIFARLRNDGHYWSRMGDLGVKHIRDLTKPGWDSDLGTPSLPVSSGTQMITYKFSNGATATLRTSGTEPKLKWYSELRGADPVVARAELKRTINMVLDEMIQPELHGLKRPVRD